MKKIVLALLTLSIMSFGGNYEDAKTAFKNKEYKKSLELSKKACEGGHAMGCEFNKDLTDLLANASTSHQPFTVDGLKSGMSINAILPMKFKKRADGQYSVLQGSTDATTEMFYGKEQSGDFIAYETEILGEKGTVYLWFTKKTKKLYAARIEWKNAGSPGDFFGSVFDVLTKKYGKGVNEKAKGKELFLNGVVWKPSKQTKISLRMVMAGYSMSVYTNYFDLKLQKQDEKEKKSLAKTTDKL